MAEVRRGSRPRGIAAFVPSLLCAFFIVSACATQKAGQKGTAESGSPAARENSARQDGRASSVPVPASAGTVSGAAEEPAEAAVSAGRAEAALPPAAAAAPEKDSSSAVRHIKRIKTVFHSELFEREELSAGTSLLLARLPAKSSACIDLCLRGPATVYDALGLILAAREAEADFPGPEAGALSLKLRVLAGNSLCLELSGEPEILGRAAAALCSAVVHPRFSAGGAGSGNRQDDEDAFQGALRYLEIAALKREDAPYSPLGGDAELYSARLDVLAADWKHNPRQGRLFFCAAGGFSADSLAGTLSAALGPLSPAQRPDAQGGYIPQTANAQTVLSSRAPLAAGTLRASFPLPPLSSPERADLILALSIVQDEFEKGSAGGYGAAGGKAAQLPRPECFSFYFEEGPQSLGYIEIANAQNPAAVRQEIESIIARFKYGSLPNGNSGLITDAAFAAAKARAITRTYNCDDSPREIAYRLATGTALGGDGLSFFRLGTTLLAETRALVEDAALNYLEPEDLVWTGCDAR